MFGSISYQSSLFSPESLSTLAAYNPRNHFSSSLLFRLWCSAVCGWAVVERGFVNLLWRLIKCYLVKDFRKRKKSLSAGVRVSLACGRSFGGGQRFEGGVPWSVGWERVDVPLAGFHWCGLVGVVLSSYSFVEDRSTNRFMLKLLVLVILDYDINLLMEFLSLTFVFVYMIYWSHNNTSFRCLNTFVDEVYSYSRFTSRKANNKSRKGNNKSRKGKNSRKGNDISVDNPEAEGAMSPNEAAYKLASDHFLALVWWLDPKPCSDSNRVKIFSIWRMVYSVAVQVFLGLLYTRLSGLNYLFLVYIPADAYLGFLLISLLKFILCNPGMEGNRIEYDVEQMIDSPANLLVKITIRVLSRFIKSSFTELSFTLIVDPHVPFIKRLESEQLGVSDPVIPSPGNYKDESPVVYITSSQLKGYCKKNRSW